MNSLSVVVPIYNEEGNIPPLYQQVSAVMTGIGAPWELLLVDDGSRDGSAAALDKLAEADSHVKVIHFKRNCGQTAAMMAGFDYATGDIVLPMDGDLQNDPKDIPRLLAKLDEGFDVVSGWRKDRKDNAIKRTLPSKVANGLISMISGVHLHDYGCSLKAYRREVLDGVELYGEMHRFIPVYASWQGAKVTEIPVTHHPRTKGVSKYGISRTYKVVLDLIVVKFLEKYLQKPIYVFGSFGFMNFMFAVFAFGLMVYFKYWGGKTFIQTPLPMVIVMFSMVGVLSVLMGLIAEVLNRTYHESQGKHVYLIKSTKNLGA